MDNKKNGCPAFPTREHAIVREGDKWITRHEGMTLRDYFAEQALAGLLARDDNSIDSYIVGMAYRYADAMMQERDK